MQGKKLSDHSKANSQAWEAGGIRLINMHTSQPQGTDFFSEGRGDEEEPPWYFPAQVYLSQSWAIQI